MSNIIIDTPATATDTIDYVAADNAGNVATATSTRAIIIEAAPPTPPRPLNSPRRRPLRIELIRARWAAPKSSKKKTPR